MHREDMEQIKGLAGLGYGEKKNRNAPGGESADHRGFSAIDREP